MNNMTEKKATHTPGPWKEDFGEIFAPNHQHSVARVYNKFDDNSVANDLSAEEANANARLIAAAPSLISAHHEIRKAISEFTGGNLEFFISTLDKISSAAITKATGGK